MDRALTELRENVSVPLSRARAMPTSVYTSDAHCKLEIERIFRREWFCAGRAEGLPNPGDYVAFELAGQPVAVGARCGRQIACPGQCLPPSHVDFAARTGQHQDHRLSVSRVGPTVSTGACAGAPGMARNEAFDRRSCRLPEIRLVEWLGWILVTLDGDQPDPAERLGKLAGMIADYDMESYRQSFFEIHEWNTNWKVLAENFMESYHLPVCHAETIGGLSRVDEIECPEGFEAFNYHTLQKEESFRLSIAHPKNTQLKGERRLTTYLFAIYPALLITLTPGYFWYLSVHPVSPGKVRFFYGGGLSRDFSEEPEAQEDFEGVKSLLDHVNMEDKACTERVYAGLCSDFAEPGHLSHLERPNYEFATYLAQMTADSRPAI